MIDYSNRLKKGRYVVVGDREVVRMDEIVIVPSNYWGDIFRVKCGKVSAGIGEKVLDDVQEGLEEFK
jgi:hypothetical protein